MKDTKNKKTLILGIIVLFLVVAGTGFAIYTQAVVKPRQLKWEEKVYPYVDQIHSQAQLSSTEPIHIKNVEFYDISNSDNTDVLTDEQDIQTLKELQTLAHNSLLCLIETDEIPDYSKYYLLCDSNFGDDPQPIQIGECNTQSKVKAEQWELACVGKIKVMKMCGHKTGDVSISRINKKLNQT